MHHLPPVQLLLHLWRLRSPLATLHVLLLSTAQNVSTPTHGTIQQVLLRAGTMASYHLCILNITAASSPAMICAF